MLTQNTVINRCNNCCPIFGRLFGHNFQLIERVSDLSAFFSLNTGQIFNYKTTKERLQIWLANSAIIFAFQLQLNDISKKDPDLLKNRRAFYQDFLPRTVTSPHMLCNVLDWDYVNTSFLSKPVNKILFSARQALRSRVRILTTPFSDTFFRR